MKKQTKVKEKKFFLKPEFKTLQEEWYTKLADEGFVDTETLKDIRTNSVNQQIITVNEEWIQYNQECINYLASGMVADPLNEYILKRHCDGVSNQVIARELPEVGLESVTPMTVGRRLRAMLEDAQIKPIAFNV